MSFEPRTIVNGKLLRQFIGKNISIVMQVAEDLHSQTNFKAKSTDDCDIRVNLSEPLNARKNDWIEIIGTPAGPDAVRAREAILFTGEQNFDAEGHNVLVQLLNNCNDIFRQG